MSMIKTNIGTITNKNTNMGRITNINSGMPIKSNPPMRRSAMIASGIMNGAANMRNIPVMIMIIGKNGKSISPPIMITGRARSANPPIMI